MKYKQNQYIVLLDKNTFYNINHHLTTKLCAFVTLLYYIYNSSYYPYTKTIAFSKKETSI